MTNSDFDPVAVALRVYAVPSRRGGARARPAADAKEEAKGTATDLDHRHQNVLRRLSTAELRRLARLPGPTRQPPWAVLCGTAAVRFRSFKQLFKWLVRSGQIVSSPMQVMQPPRIPDDPVPVISEKQLDILFCACAGTAFRGPPRYSNPADDARHRDKAL